MRHALLVCVVVGTLLAGCTPNPPTGSAPAEPAAAADTWEAEWERTLAAAKQEGEVVLYADPNAQVRQAFTEAFERRYGIRVAYVGMSGNQAAARILAEQQGGVHATDLAIGGGTTAINVLKPSGHLQPVAPLMILPEVKDPGNWVEGHHYSAPDDDLVYIYNISANYPFTINTTLFRPGEVSSVNDLLRPTLKGKIGISDPRGSGPGVGNWGYWLATPSAGEPFLRALAAQDLFITTDRRTLTDRVARGALAIAIGTDPTYAKELAQAGLPIAVDRTFPREGTFVSPSGGTLVAFKDAPHPNAMKVYLNWFLSREGMELSCAANLQPCLRTDMKAPPDADPSLGELLSLGVPYLETHTPEGIERQNRAVESAKRLLPQ